MAQIVFRSDRNQDIQSDIILGPVGKRKISNFSNNISDVFGFEPKVPGDQYKYLLHFGLSVFAADKGVKRNEAKDSWTRNLAISLPDSHIFEPSIQISEDLLSFLSGDNWTISLRNENYEFNALGIQSLFPFTNPDAICLFSGGLDSLVGVIDLLEENKKIVLVSHYEAGFTSEIQHRLLNELKLNYPKNQIHHVQFLVRAPKSNESSSRARSFLFFALAFFVAGCFDNNPPILVPENGFISINPPLTGSRMGSYSTRTTHPYYMEKIKELKDSLNIPNNLSNPLQNYSKGEAILKCANISFLKSVYKKSVSCSKSGANRWRGESALKNCGSCFPCLIRRASLHALEVDDPADYCFDAIGDDTVYKTKSRGSDLRNLIRGLHNYISNPSNIYKVILSHGFIPDNYNINDLIKPVEDGYKEIIQLINDKGHDTLKRNLNINTQSP